MSILVWFAESLKPLKHIKSTPREVCVFNSCFPVNIKGLKNEKKKDLSEAMLNYTKVLNSTLLNYCNGFIFPSDSEIYSKH